ncbi:MAG: lipopolysaccharide heptosyltransferase II [Candidatus Gastranaerophilales bacterium]|nr:lipopolysaccharide heptosyltransferase II [Candidatus Gastranaerophilales bacterium]
MKILVVRYRFIGDTILTIPFLRNLRKLYPDAQIDMLAGPVSGEILKECPYIDNLIEFDTTSKHKYENKTNQKTKFLDYVKQLKETGYDKAYVLKRSLSSALLVFLAGIKERIGFDTEYRGLLLTKPVPYLYNRHENECFLDLLRAEGHLISEKHLENWVNKASEEKINEIFEEKNIQENQPKIIIHATSGNSKKQWSLEYFAKVIEHLSNQREVQIFYTGTENDYKTYEKIHSLIKTPLKVMPINLCGTLTLSESTALISKMDLMMGCDSGNLHIAASLNIPVVGIYGPMNPIKWQAYGENHTCLWSSKICVPCDLRKKCPHNYECLKDITPDKIINACNLYINKVLLEK